LSPHPHPTHAHPASSPCAHAPSSPFFFKSYRDHRDLHSFPTRRSSDLAKFRSSGRHVSGEKLGEEGGKLLCLHNGRLQVVDGPRSEEHTSELQSLTNLVCRLLLEKKKKTQPQASRLHRITAPEYCDTRR